MGTDTDYNFTRFYKGTTGAIVEVKPYSGRNWIYRLCPEKQWRCGKLGDAKFGALLHAAWECGTSMEKMNWTPTDKPKAKRPGGRKGFVGTALERMSK